MTESLARTKTAAVILAAGQGTRMRSATPKVMHSISGRPLVHYPVRAAIEAGCDQVIVVVGHGKEVVTQYLNQEFGDRVQTALQVQQRGTGDAALAGMVALQPGISHMVVYYGDVPLVTAEDVRRVVEGLGTGAGEQLALATCHVDDPFGYGRIMRDAAGQILEIREQKDLRSDAERDVREINPGIYAAGVAFFREALGALEPNNAQKELYLTDIVSFARRKGIGICGVDARAEVLLGVNDRVQLAEAEAVMGARLRRRWRLAGVTVREGAQIEDTVELGQDTTVGSHAVLRGKTRVGTGVVIDVGCVLTDAIVGNGVVLKAYSVVTESQVDSSAQVGPFSHLRPGSLVGEEAHVGNFVETKKTRLGRGAKANHLAYLGDGIVGDGANIGAGTIFCNYDGFKKHTTVIGKNAFIGSDSQLVAPVIVGDGAYVATGTTVTRDVPPDSLAIARVKQENKEGYAQRLKSRLSIGKGSKENP